MYSLSVAKYSTIPDTPDAHKYLYLEVCDINLAPTLYNYTLSKTQVHMISLISDNVLVVIMCFNIT